MKIFNMMTSWDTRITKLEKRDEARADEKEKVSSPPRQSEAVALVEQAFSPQQSPRSSPFKGLKSVADERRAFKRGRDQGIENVPIKCQRVSREMVGVKGPVISGVRPFDITAGREVVRPSVVGEMGGVRGIRGRLI